MIKNTDKNTDKRIRNLKAPWKPGQSGNPNGRPKGKRNFKTDFEIAAREVAKALRLGEKPDPIYVALMKAGIKSGLKGNYNFWKDIVERIYGKEPDKVEGSLELKEWSEKIKKLLK